MFARAERESSFKEVFMQLQIPALYNSYMTLFLDHMSFTTVHISCTACSTSLAVECLPKLIRSVPKAKLGSIPIADRTCEILAVACGSVEGEVAL